jgi:hypothetical protein
MNWTEGVIAAISAPLVVAVVGGLLAFYLDRRKAAEERAFTDKREHYRTLLFCLKSLREGKSEHIDAFWYEYAFLWLHAPYPVIRSANILVAKIKEGSAEAEVLAPFVGDLLLQIRRDMGFLKTTLLQADFKGKLG